MVMVDGSRKMVPGRILEIRRGRSTTAEDRLIGTNGGKKKNYKKYRRKDT